MSLESVPTPNHSEKEKMELKRKEIRFSQPLLDKPDGMTEAGLAMALGRDRGDRFRIMSEELPAVRDSLLDKGLWRELEPVTHKDGRSGGEEVAERKFCLTDEGERVLRALPQSSGPAASVLQRAREGWEE